MAWQALQFVLCVYILQSINPNSANIDYIDKKTMQEVPRSIRSILRIQIYTPLCCHTQPPLCEKLGEPCQKRREMFCF